MPIPLPEPLPNPCLAFDFPTIEPLPDPLTIGIPIPDISLDLDLCCKLPNIADFIPPIALPPGIFSPAIVATINSAIVSMFAFFDAQQFNCPLE